MSALTESGRFPSGQTCLAVVMSVVVHGIVFSFTAKTSKELGPEPLPLMSVEMLPPQEVEAPPEPPPEPEAEPEQEPEPPPVISPRPLPDPPVEPEATPSESSEEEESVAEEAVEAEEVAAGEAGDAAEPSDVGEPVDGPALRGAPSGTPGGPKGRGGGKRKAKARPKAVSVRPSAPVPLADLSARPAPPPLNSQLERNYPTGARLQGRSGSARVALLIDKDGRVRSVRPVSSSDPEFGEACRKTLLDSRWTPPRDAEGKAVATIVPYECRFQVSR